MGLLQAYERVTILEEEMKPITARCAEMNAQNEQLKQEYNDKMALVVRNVNKNLVPYSYM